MLERCGQESAQSTIRRVRRHLTDTPSKYQALTDLRVQPHVKKNFSISATNNLAGILRKLKRVMESIAVYPSHTNSDLRCCTEEIKQDVDEIRILWFEQNQPGRNIKDTISRELPVQPGQPFLSSATCTLKSALFLRPEVVNVPGGSIRNTLEPPGGNIPTELNSSRRSI